MSPLISAAELATHLGDPTWVILDCRFRLTAPDTGREAYSKGHVPGAVYADLDKDLAAPRQPGQGRHPLPERAAFAARCAAWGIRNDSRVAVYDDQNGAVAARAWWLLRWLGHERVCVVEGGIQSWSALGLPLSTEVPQARTGVFEVASRVPDLIADSAEIEQLDTTKTALLDARSQERFQGVHEPIDSVAGHIPGARNWPFEENLTASGKLVGRDQIIAGLRARVGAVSGTGVIAMCGSGVTACHLLWALECAGITGARLYPGSWSEWITDPQRPIATGPANS